MKEIRITFVSCGAIAKVTAAEWDGMEAGAEFEEEKLRIAAVPIYTSAMLPVVLFTIGQLPLYFDILWAAYV
ncbi:hypothetical protein SASPL_135660 [Salvia splendens]|uniref:Uncharacterized protein n=1 Tax=Salvia splendens TaxID=180675 RepID=A0A8X8ZGU1_SALSN|nr:hypothetical protein SASPL_135660 [Salvia splendens]